MKKNCLFSGLVCLRYRCVCRFPMTNYYHAFSVWTSSEPAVGMVLVVQEILICKNESI